MEIVLGIEKKMSDEGYKSNISRIAWSGAGSMALAKHAASVTILSPANNTQLKGLKKHYGAVPEFCLWSGTAKEPVLRRCAARSGSRTSSIRTVPIPVRCRRRIWRSSKSNG
jgi:hypothetical protein